MLATGASSGDAIAGAFDDQVPLKVGNGAEHMKHQLARRGHSVEALLERAEPEPARLEAFHSREQLLERPSRSRRTTHNAHQVARARVVQQVGEASTLKASARSHVLKHADRAGLVAQAAALDLQILLGGGNAGVAQDFRHVRSRSLAHAGQRALYGCFGVDAGGVKQRHRAVLWSDQQHDLRAAQDDGLGAALDQARNHRTVGVA